MIKTIGILTGGGDSSGINAAIRTIVRRAVEAGVQVKGIRRGWAGLVDDMVDDFDMTKTDHILYHGGTVLGTSRTNPFKSDAGVKNIENTINKHAIDSLIVLGGDDTLGVAHRVAETLGISVIGIAQSIDNDIAETEYCIGFDTAVSNVVAAVNNVRTTCESHDQDIVIEVMGRETGWIAAMSAVASEAEFCLIPEIPFDINRLAKDMVDARSKQLTPNVVLVAEGCQIQDTERLEHRVDAFGHPYLAGIGYSVRDALMDKTGLTIRVIILSYLQRGGIPTSYEVQMAVRLGHEAVECALSGDTDKLMAVKGGDIIPVPLSAISGRKRYVSGELLDLVKTNWYSHRKG